MLAFRPVPRPKVTRSILAVFAHPDDEAFLVGGTLAHYARQGVRVELLCLTRGEKGSTSRLQPGEAKTLARTRQSELQRCCAVLGAHLLSNRLFPDGRLAEIDPARLARPIEKIIRARRPDLVLTFGPDGLTGHPDHLAIHQATTLAFRQAALPGTALFYASLAAHNVDRLSHKMEGDLDGLTLRLAGVEAGEISATIDIRHTSHLKWAALGCHRSQASNFEGLNQADFHLLSQAEHFRLAYLTGESSAPHPVQSCLFDVFGRTAKTYLSLAS